MGEWVPRTIRWWSMHIDGGCRSHLVSLFGGINMRPHALWIFNQLVLIRSHPQASATLSPDFYRRLRDPCFITPLLRLGSPLCGFLLGSQKAAMGKQRFILTQWSDLVQRIPPGVLRFV